jgi:hypothetical protein
VIPDEYRNNFYNKNILVPLIIGTPKFEFFLLLLSWASLIGLLGKKKNLSKALDTSKIDIL